MGGQGWESVDPAVAWRAHGGRGRIITGIQTMPSVAWVPWAILLFRQIDATVLFVIVLGTTPAVANGSISGADHIPPILLRAGRVLGARGFAAYRHVILPASLPGFVSGLKQGWAFAWRSLMAGEIIVTIAREPKSASCCRPTAGSAGPTACSPSCWSSWPWASSSTPSCSARSSAGSPGDGAWSTPAGSAAAAAWHAALRLQPDLWSVPAASS
jgi:hypothetical protein